MSNSERHELIGQLVERYNFVKRDKGLIEAQLRECGGKMTFIAKALHDGSIRDAQRLLQDEIVQRYGLDKLRTMTKEVEDLENELNSIRTQAEQAGIPLS